MGKENTTILPIAALLGLFGCAESGSQFQYKLMGEMGPANTPQSVSEAIHRLHQLVPPEARAAFLRCEKDYSNEYCRDFGLHFEISFRRHIGNAWMRPKDSPLANAYRESGISNPELMAYALVQEYVESLHDAE